MEAGQDLWLADGQGRGEPQREGRKVTGSASKGRKACCCSPQCLLVNTSESPGSLSVPLTAGLTL